MVTWPFSRPNPGDQSSSVLLLQTPEEQKSCWGDTRTQYLTFWTLQMAPPQEWCCSCWWNRNQLSGAPPRDGLVSHPYAKSWTSSQIVLFLSKVALNSWPQTYRVKTPAARPMVVSLALCSASPSDSNDSTDMTGPKISSFTQVMSSVQLATTKKNAAGKWTRWAQM